MPRAFIMVLAMIAASATAALAQDARKGEIVFHRCLPCHSIGPGAENTIGPELNGLDGRAAGTAPNFDYRDSDANKKSGIVWNEATFKQYMRDPQGTIPGTKMIFPGVQNLQEAEDLWAYVKQFNTDGSLTGELKDATAVTVCGGFATVVPSIGDRPRQGCEQ
jgi:cytochrome c